MKTIGDRMKFYESFTTKQILMPRLPVMARLDGKAFHTFTRGLKRPYDKRLSDLMVETTKYLVEQTNANCGYTQSDEITLVWYLNDKSEMPYGGKIFKLQSDYAAMCSVYFNKRLVEFLPEKVDAMPRFDCRVWNVPTLEDAVTCFVWRENDATKNSISMLAQSEFSHKQLQNKNGSEMQDMLMLQKGLNWNDYPSFFKRGVYIQRQIKTGLLSKEEIKNLPPKHNAIVNKNFTYERKVVVKLDLPQISKIKNKIDVIIFGKEYELF